jgi:hypothetical protein
VDEWCDEEEERGSTPPGSAVRGRPMVTHPWRMTGKIGKVILEEMGLEANGISYPLKWFYVRFCVFFIIAGLVISCGRNGVSLEGDVPDGPNPDGFLDPPAEEDAADIEDPELEPWLPCITEPRSECRVDYTACTEQKPFCCLTGNEDIPTPCCCEDPECGGRFPAIQRCYETPLLSIVMDCSGDSSNCPAVKPYCCWSGGRWGGLYVCADHALLNWTCDEPPEI